MTELYKMAERRTTSPSLKCCSIVPCGPVLVAFVICLLLGPSHGMECKFPRYLQESTLDAAPWITNYKDEGSFQGYFKGPILKASKCDGDNCVMYQRKCLAKLKDDKFLVKHITDDNDIQYLCMQFIKRSSSIIQIKESIMLPYRKDDICNDENLTLDKWPLITVKRFHEQQVPCPFSGGYDIHFFLSNDVATCPRQVVPPRLESECEPGDGITINFQEEECMSDNLQMTVKQSLHCAATWEHGKYTFVILRPQNEEQGLKAWCMRITGTGNLDKIEHAYLFMDFVCDPGDESAPVRETTNYMYLEFKARIVNSICANIAPLCDEARLCDHEVSRNCPKTCKFCKDDITPCTFPAQFQGQWVQYEDGNKAYVNISYYELSMSGAGQFQCHEQDEHDFENNTMLLQTFDNGCFPRFTCLEIHKPSASTLEYRLGNRISWPLKHWDNLKATVCDDREFRPNHKDMMKFGKQIDTKPTTTLIDGKHHYPTFCGLDNRWFRDTELYVKEKDHCDMCLFYDSVNHPKRLVEIPLNCSKDTHTHTRRDFKCINSFDHDDGTTHGIITRTLHQHEEYLCWVFVEKDDVPDERGVIYILDASNCDGIAIDAVKQGYLEPKKTYNIPKRSCPYIGQVISTSTTPDTKITHGPYRIPGSTKYPSSEKSIYSGDSVRHTSARLSVGVAVLVAISIGRLPWFS